MTRSSHRDRPQWRERRGSALFLVMIMSAALAGLALSAIYLGSHATLVTKAFDREREYRYAAEAALAMGRAQLGQDASLVLDDSVPTQLLRQQPIMGADGRPVPGVLLNMWVARTGSKTGEHGLYASIIAEARDSSGGGAKFVRRLELMEENFARFLDWSNDWARNGCYGTGEIMDGPVFSNASIGVCGGWFKDSVASASTIGDRGTFDKGQQEYQRRIEMPSLARLERLRGYATSGNYYIDAPTNGDATTARLRIEFVWWDLDGDGTAVGDPQEGFFRVYTNQNANRIRADYRSNSDDYIKDNQCGDWHYMDGKLQFFPVSVHDESWFRDAMLAPPNRNDNRNLLPGYADWANGPTGEAVILAHASAANRAAIMRGGRPTTAPGRKMAGALYPRCFPAGDPHLAPTERSSSGGTWTNADLERGGDSASFTPSSPASVANGNWLPWTGPAVDWSRFPAAYRPPANMRPYLWPIDRELNPSTKGVIYVNGTVAVSGVLNGRITLYSNASITFVDDLTYATDPSSPDCDDMLGLIAAQEITIADNGINTAQDPVNGGDPGDTWMDDDMHFTLHGVLMALDTFVPERWNAGAVNMSTCNGQNIGRGCIYQVGGAIVNHREVTYDGAHGFMESRTYDKRMSRDSPPYFPTTGRYSDNRFYEVDPQGFEIGAYLNRIGQHGS
ncbi:MAG TPA: hypothetical protein VFS08_19455 [Gemmatimonadaceae bacterium]|nr:hypothetical protein [Gemmatimonadaceae bacterium]